MGTKTDPTLDTLARGLPRTALDALYDALAKLPQERAARGRLLAAGSSPAGVDADARGVRANVSDGHQYVTRWAWTEGGASSLCSCAAGRACEHAFALGVWLLAAARRGGRWDHAHWGRLAPSALAAERVVLPAATLPAPGGSPPGTRARHEHAVEALAQWADRGHDVPRRLRAVLHLEPAMDMAPGHLPEAGPEPRAVLTLEARVTAPGVNDAPRTWRQLEQLASDVKRHPRWLTPPEARLLRALTAAEFAATYVPGDTRMELSSERMQALLDRVPESPHFTWSETVPPALARRAGIEAGGRASLQTDEVRIVPVCDTRVEPPRLELSLEWPDGATRPLAEAVLLSPLGLASGGRTHVALVGGRFVRIVEEPPREVVKLLQEGGLELRQNDGAVLERLSRSFPVVRSALHRLTRVHAVDVIGSFELAADDWLRVRVFAASREAGWSPGAIPPEGAVFEYRPALGWMRLSPGDHVRGDVETVGETTGEGQTTGEGETTAEGDAGSGQTDEAPATDDAVAAPAPASPPAEPADGAGEHGAAAAGAEPEQTWFELPDPDLVAPIVEWVESLPQGDHSGKRKRGPRTAHVPLGAPAGWWLRLTPQVMEALADAWDVRPRGARWYADAGASGLFRTRHAVARVRVAASGVDWFTVSAEWQAEGLSLLSLIHI